MAPEVELGKERGAAAILCFFASKACTKDGFCTTMVDNGLATRSEDGTGASF
jgi:hypothetical protein